MNEQAAREVVLVRALEMADGQLEILSASERQNASRSAKELAQWQASQAGVEATAEDFLQQRAGQILQQMAARFPTFSHLLQWPAGLSRLWNWLPAVGLLAGLLMDRISEPHRVDLLSAPLLLIIGWNLLVYAALLLWPWLPLGRFTHFSGLKAGFSTLLRLGQTRLPRKLPPVLSNALADFMREWLTLSRPLRQARVACTLHLSAALFAVGAVLSLVARGYFAQYSAGWESTFLSASQVHALLAALFTPAELVFRLQGFSLADIQTLRFGQTPSALGGARWVTLYAATLVLLVVLPRLLLAGVAAFKLNKLTTHFPLDLDQAYFRKLLPPAPGGAHRVLRVLPYSFSLDETREQGLRVLASLLLGEQAQLQLHPSIAYGDEPEQALSDFAPNDDDDAMLSVVLFNLAATPEAENQGALLQYLADASTRGVLVLLDESSYLERFGQQADGAVRMAERSALWRQFCSFHKASAHIVNLLKPEAHALGSGLNL